MNPDGSEHRRLMPRPPAGRKASLAWSPDGRKLAFLSDYGHGDFNFDLYVMNADGSGRRNLTRVVVVVIRSCLVARRAEDRLCEQPRRQRTSSS